MLPIFSTLLYYAPTAIAMERGREKESSHRHEVASLSIDVKENTTVGYSATDVLFQGEHTFPRRSFIVARLMSRPMFFVAPEDLYSPMAEHITTDIKEVPSAALLPLKIEVQQHGLTD